MVDYLLGGHEQLYPEGRRARDEHLDAELRLSQRANPTGPLEARILYLPCFDRMKIQHRRVVRRLLWNGVVEPLPKKVDAFRVTPYRTRQIDLAARRLEGALVGVAVSMNIHYETAKELNDDDPLQLPFGKLDYPRFTRSIAARALPVDISLRFSSATVAPEVNNAWEALWDAMGACCEPKNRIRARATYPIAPRDYASALKGTPRR